MRDVILGKTPSAFVKPIYVEVAVISALAPFLLLSINKRLVHSKYQALYAGLMFLMDWSDLGSLQRSEYPQDGQQDIMIICFS